MTVDQTRVNQTAVNESSDTAVVSVETEAAAPGWRSQSDAGIPWWEWVLAGLALLAIARSPLLFLRQETMDIFGGEIPRQWRDDTLLVSAFITVQLAVLVVALVRCPPRTLLRQPWLLGLLAVAWASTAWSVMPEVTQQRALTFAGTAVIGWYIGARWSLRGQVAIVAGSGAVGAFASVLLLVFWWDRAQATEGLVSNRWHGIYLNANLFGLAMAIAVIATVVMIFSLRGRWQVAAIIAAAVEAFLLLQTDSIASQLTCIAAILVMGFVALLRRVRPQLRLPLAAGAGAIVAVGTALVLAFDSILLDRFGRSSTLSGRTEMWEINADYFGEKPLKGWGFEALFRYPPAIEDVTERWGRYPWSAHSGYYEVLLGVGLIGLAFFLVFLAVTTWRSGRFALRADPRDYISLWPIGILAYALLINTAESFITSNEPPFALVVAVAVAVTAGNARRARTASSGDAR